MALPLLTYAHVRMAPRALPCARTAAVSVAGAANIQVLLKDAVERGSFAKISREEAEHALQQMIEGDLVPREDIDRYYSASGAIRRPSTRERASRSASSADAVTDSEEPP